MWKDWQELGLVIILGMLLAGFFSHVDRSASGSMFATMRSPVANASPAPAQQTSAAILARPEVLHYQASTAGERIQTFVYGPSHAARIICGKKRAALHWSQDRHSVEIPQGCQLLPNQSGIYTSSSNLRT